MRTFPEFIQSAIFLERATELYDGDTDAYLADAISDTDFVEWREELDD